MFNMDDLDEENRFLIEEELAKLNEDAVREWEAGIDPIRPIPEVPTKKEEPAKSVIFKQRDEEGKITETFVAGTNQKIFSRLKDREELRKERSYLVESIIPCGRIHVLAGPSGAGKSRWFQYFIKDWSEGKEVIKGYKSYPQPYLYVSCDRSLDSVDETLQSLGLGDWDINAIYVSELYSMFNISPLSTIKIEDLLWMFQGIKVFFIEAAAWFEKDGMKAGMYANNLRYWQSISDRFAKQGKTIIFTTHTPKTKPTEKYENPRDRIIGSVACAASCDTLFLLENTDIKDDTNRRRTLRVLCRNQANLVIDLMIDESGRLVDYTPEPGEDEKIEHKDNIVRISTKKGALNDFLSQGLDNFSTQDVVRFAKERGISAPTAYRWIDEKISAKEIAGITKFKGRYKPL